MRTTQHHSAARLIELTGGRRGHFRLESGHHGELWLDLDGLFLRPARLTPFIRELGERIRADAPADGICGPVLGGAAIAYSIAEALDLEYYPAERAAPSAGAGLYSARYRVPEELRGRLAGRRVAVVDDVINAGSATRATVADLREAGATVVAIAALLVLGSPGADYARREGIPILSVATLPNRLWEPGSCPLCDAGAPLEDLRAGAG